MQAANAAERHSHLAIQGGTVWRLEERPARQAAFNVMFFIKVIEYFAFGLRASAY